MLALPLGVGSRVWHPSTKGQGHARTHSNYPEYCKNNFKLNVTDSFIQHLSHNMNYNIFNDYLFKKAHNNLRVIMSSGSQFHRFVATMGKDSLKQLVPDFTSSSQRSLLCPK